MPGHGSRTVPIEMKKGIFRALDMSGLYSFSDATFMAVVKSFNSPGELRVKRDFIFSEEEVIFGKRLAPPKRILAEPYFVLFVFCVDRSGDVAVSYSLPKYKPTCVLHPVGEYL